MTSEIASSKRLTVEELTGFLELSLECAERACANGLRFDFYEPRHRYAVLLLRVVLDHARDVVALNKAARFGAVAIITRSALDAYADIANLGDHASYWEHLVAADASSWKPLLERASQGKNPVLKALSEDDMLPVGRAHYAQELKAMQAKGVAKLDIGERFQRAGLTNEYEATYAILSAEAHNNVSGLQSRYIDWDENSAWIIDVGQESRHRHHYETACTLTMSEIVIQSMEKMLRLLGHGIAVMGPARLQLGQIWAQAQAEETMICMVAEKDVGCLGP
jgi:hypothetical protein